MLEEVFRYFRYFTEVRISVVQKVLHSKTVREIELMQLNEFISFCMFTYLLTASQPLTMLTATTVLKEINEVSVRLHQHRYQR